MRPTVGNDFVIKQIYVDLELNTTQHDLLLVVYGYLYEQKHRHTRC